MSNRKRAPVVHLKPRALVQVANNALQMARDTSPGKGVKTRKVFEE